jgi:5'-methylthioadenosine phosphorylase
MTQQPTLGIIGGSGLYHMSGLEQIETLELDTPFGKPSAPLVAGLLEGRKVVFLARHGLGHTISPSDVNYRANIYALKAAGVQKVVSISACGSLREEYQPGNIVVPDQIFDFTRGTRPRTFFGDGLVAHVGTADPFCADLSGQVYEAVQAVGGTVHRGGTFITIEGPRFSTKAESNLFRAWGMSIIGMTASPECFLAREAELCYAVMAHVTDYDVWHVSEAPVTVEMVIRTLLSNTALAQQAVAHLAESVPPERNCACANALADALISDKTRVPFQTRRRLDLLVGRYWKD